MATIKSAISLYGADVSTSSVLAPYGTLWANANAVTPTSSFGISASGFGFQPGSMSVKLNSSSSRAVDGTGWIPVNLTLISSGAPIGSLPVDPVNTASNTYVFAASSTVFKVATKMESTKYSFGGGGDVVSTDGGNSTSTYEVGTNITGL